MSVMQAIRSLGMRTVDGGRTFQGHKEGVLRHPSKPYMKSRVQIRKQDSI